MNDKTIPFTIRNFLLFLQLLLLGLWGESPLSAQPSHKARVIELYRFGEVIRSSSSYRLGDRSGVFLKLESEKRSRCFFLERSGDYPLTSLREQFGQRKKTNEFFSCNLRALVLRLKSPARMVVAPDPRGEPEAGEEEKVFEEIWQQLVMEEETASETTELLAAGLWYFKSKPQRTSYLLEKAYEISGNRWLLNLHHEAYAASSPKAIEVEIQATRNALRSIYRPENNLALLIGIEDYPDTSRWKDLQTPVNDINALKNLLIGKFSYAPQNVLTLPDASYQDLLDAIALLRKKVNPQTNLMVYYAGHGWIDEDGEYFWIPSDGLDSPRSWIYTDYFLNKIKSLNTLHTLFVVDSCFGGALNSHVSRGYENEGVEKLFRKRSRQLITAGGKEPVADKGKGDHSVFAEAFLDVLRLQPEDKPLGVQELFSRLQPLVVNRSNQTPTYDRIANSQDEWGQYYFIQDYQSFEKPGAKQELPRKAEDSKPGMAKELIESFDFSKPAGKEGRITSLSIEGDRSLISVSDILAEEPFSMKGGSLLFGLKMDRTPLRLKIQYLLDQTSSEDQLTVQGKTYEVPRSINRVDLKLGVHKVRETDDAGWIHDSGLSYYWKRIQMEWDASELPTKKTDTEFINVGYHLLDLQYYRGKQLNTFLDLGYHYNYIIGLMNFSGSTAVVRSEKYNIDVSNLMLGASIRPEARFRFPVIHGDLFLGLNLEYLWQPLDDKGGSRSGDNRISTTQRSAALYANISINL